MLYTDDDRVKANQAVHRETKQCLLAILPLLIGVIVTLFLRLRILCTILAILTCFVSIFLVDNRLVPTLQYRRWLREVLSGLSHETAGRLMRIGDEDVWEEGVRLRELILNIYADGSEEGERRFLLDASKTIPEEFMGRVVIVTSHDTSVLCIVPRGEEAAS